MRASEYKSNFAEGAPLRCLCRVAGGASWGREVGRGDEIIEGKRMQARGKSGRVARERESEITPYAFERSKT